ncbi:hypothetical protein MPC4_330006 [Methylocella tundrae]|uniref:Uncharacterized protein n=1 Tax=Methylocella tundrae TaxID=227605 RepID=A0A8B6M8J5_METTU|nr:hypothetical protein MPC4_330006 [Methylocella tundrae]
MTLLFGKQNTCDNSRAVRPEGGFIRRYHKITICARQRCPKIVSRTHKLNMECIQLLIRCAKKGRVTRELASAGLRISISLRASSQRSA